MEPFDNLMEWGLLPREMTIHRNLWEFRCPWNTELSGTHPTEEVLLDRA